MILTRCIEILNEPDRCVMTTCSQITENDLSEDFLDCLSRICHNLLLSHRMALHKYRLLYTLAFKPIFLRGLWRWLSHMSHESSFGGSATPLLSALSLILAYPVCNLEAAVGYTQFEFSELGGYVAPCGKSAWV
ncbi:hypothetical protein MSG28_011149 [Choristoneura fumiferana]|uniref:Uncharacterized protein n=1 Tax=Choristoneura fumiferana TaxID=7141 RepID=A0ACC0KQD3_CHOFU|nr:hypothetical protein MSG28_011149 [Choristoneura fumiferana]